MPEVDTGVTYTLPNFENQDKDIDLVSEKVSALISLYSKAYFRPFLEVWSSKKAKHI